MRLAPLFLLLRKRNSLMCRKIYKECPRLSTGTGLWGLCVFNRPFLLNLPHYVDVASRELIRADGEAKWVGKPWLIIKSESILKFTVKTNLHFTTLINASLYISALKANGRRYKQGSNIRTTEFIIFAHDIIHVYYHYSSEKHCCGCLSIARANGIVSIGDLLGNPI